MIGLMSGTSYDGIDVAAADFHFDGAEIVLRPLGDLEHPHDPAVRDLIGQVLPPARVSLEDVCRLDTLLGQAFAEAAARGIAELADGRADLVVSHGQTVFHWIESGQARGTLQLGQPAWIAQRTGAPVVSDLRSRDITRGGQGAPLVSILDVLLLPPGPVARAALNLGGIANLTLVRPDGTVLAYDLGPANALIDLACRRYFDRPYDVDGALAASGTVHEGLLEALLDEPYFDRPAPKSTGKELFHAGYLDARLERFAGLAPVDVIATVTELTARVVVRDCQAHDVGDLIVSGGGVRNAWLMRRISELAGVSAAVGDSTEQAPTERAPTERAHTERAHTENPTEPPAGSPEPAPPSGQTAATSAGTLVIRPIDDLGLPADSKEAYAFGLLGFLTFYGVPGTVPACTGADTASVLGSLTPGDGPLRLPEPSGAVPTRLRIEPAQARGSKHDGNDDRAQRQLRQAAGAG
ncbi:anhydro-N-acetylmuramic acid kinase [Actinopolymorpha pittospori]